MNGGNNLAKVTISGHPGSGTTTLVSILEKTFKWKSINGGQIFRNAAKNKNLSLVDFAELCLVDDKVDKELDEELMKIISDTNGPEIIESRLAGHWASKAKIECKRIWLDVDEKVRAERVQKREGGELSHVLFSIQQRAEKDDLRFQQFYEISLNNMKPYSLVIDCNDLNPEKVANKVIKHLKNEEVL
jgi:cytidylate kinase